MGAPDLISSGRAECFIGGVTGQPRRKPLPRTVQVGKCVDRNDGSYHKCLCTRLCPHRVWRRGRAPLREGINRAHQEVIVNTIRTSDIAVGYVQYPGRHGGSAAQQACATGCASPRLGVQMPHVKLGDRAATDSAWARSSSAAPPRSGLYSRATRLCAIAHRAPVVYHSPDLMSTAV